MNAHIFHLSPYDLAFLGTIFIGLTFTLLLWFTKRINQGANRFLGLALATIVLWLFWVLAIDIRLGTHFSHWIRLPLQFSLALGPLIYFYVLKITRPECKLRWKDIVHFGPVLLEQFMLIIPVKESIEMGLATYDTPTFQELNPVLHLMEAISVITYLSLSCRLIRRYHWRLNANVIDRPRYQLHWLRRLLVGFSRLWLLGILFNAVDFFYYHNQLGIQVYYPIYLFLVIMMIWIAAAAFSKSNVGVPISTLPVIKPSPSVELKHKGEWLKKVIKTNGYYKDPELSLVSLAEKLNLTTHELSRIINTVLKKSFNDFINEFRVVEVARKMEDSANDHLTILGIAFESGFNSKSTFNRAFRQMTGKSAAEYKNELKKERPSYNLTRHTQISAIISYHEATPKWSSEKLSRNYMFRNYLKTAYRNLSKHRGFSAINILGLSTGLAACLLIAFYVLDEWSYDRFNTRADSIYRVNEDIRFAGNATAYAQAPAPLAGVLKTSFPIVEQVVRIKSAGTVIVKKVNENVRENAVAFADATIFSVFTLPMSYGNPADALNEPNSVVITESTALKYFHAVNAIGQVITLNEKDRYKVTGIMKNMPERSHFNFDFLLSMASLPDSRTDVWLSNDYNTYVLLRKGSDPNRLAAALPGLMRQYIGPQLQSAAHLSIDDFEKGGNYFRLSLMPLTSIHLESSRNGELGQNGDKQYIYIFSFIAVFILLIACINFMNLSTARSAGRAKEVGVRKVLGSTRKYLVAQFLAESMLVVLAATVMAIVLAVLCLPVFNQLAGKDLRFTANTFLWLVPASLLIILVVGLLAGAYPALFLSGFQPIAVLKGKLSAGFKGGWLRSTLVVFQFSVAVLLIVATLVVYNQLQYIRHRDLGFDRTQVVIIKNVNDLGDRAKALKQEIVKLPGVSNATLTGYLPTSEARNSSALFQDQAMDQKTAVQSQTWTVDEDYLPTLSMKLAAGRNFSGQYQTDSTAMIINESAAKAMGVKNPLNKTLYYPAGNDGKQLKAYHIIGIVKDFNFSSLKADITPVVLTLGNDLGALSVRLRSGDMEAMLSLVRQSWKALAPDQEFDYSFMDQDFDQLYRTEQRTGGVFMAFTALAIGIACLGLLGLAAYAAEQRNKEIGIRKVLGANVASITRMLSYDFVKLVLIAILIASPISWYLMQQWLQAFAYRVTVQWWLIAIAGLAAVVIAILTISFQAIKAALANPVMSLRSE